MSSDDPLGRITGYTRAGTTTAYGWQATPNRDSTQTGAAPATTYAFDDANRLTSDSAGGTYTADADGRMTARPGQRFTWDSLGRLTAVLPASGSVPLATYTYDPMDRLRTADDGTTRLRFRYVGQTALIAQVVNDATGAVLTSLGTDWTGTHLLDWTGTGANERTYGTNAHHDVTWTADATGAVSTTLRYDPWGTLTSSTGASLPAFRFQGGWTDATTDLAWMVTRWYAPTLGRFISEDALTGDPADPPSRHLYAYAGGEPVGRWDPDGRAAGDSRCAMVFHEEALFRKEWNNAYDWNTSGLAALDRARTPRVTRGDSQRQDARRLVGLGRPRAAWPRLRAMAT